MNFTDKGNIGKEYKDFVIINVEDIVDYKSTAVYLRHKKTGLEVYHLVNDDVENLFAFCFRTVAKNSKGAAHITEHSVLCGSEKFPLKEPFNTLDQQSLKTFLNAMTYPEKTLYPAASVVKSDYYNLMDVYADAVFFPKLSRQTFMQEGWRVELDEKGKASIQGVVYNEMKANYSNFNQVASDKMLSAMYPDSILDYDSGGDPLVIPSLTYEEFVAFHKKFYSPSNCMLFLYGNIPTEEQLDFISDKYIARLEKSYGITEKLDLDSKKPYVAQDIQQIQTFKRIPKSTEIYDIAPDNGATGNMVASGFYLGPSSIEQTFLAEVLSGNDSAPMTRKLKASKLGEDEAPVNGNFGYVQSDCIFCYGLSGVKDGNEKKVYELVQRSLKEIYEDGIAQEDIEAAIMSIDFTLREQNRNFGPPAISIMSRAAASWSIGDSPSKLMNRISDFEVIKENIRKDPDYVKNLIKKYFLDASVVLNFCVKPSKKYFEQRQAVEESTLRAFEKNINKEQLKKDLDELHRYQEHLESEEELKCIPHLSVKDLSSDIGEIKTEYSSVKGIDGSDIPVLMNIQNTNGIVYVNVSYPYDNLEPEKFKYFELFTVFAGALGWNGKNWADCIHEEAAVFGDFGTRINFCNPRTCKDAIETINTYPDKNVAGRNYLSFCAKFLSSQLERAFELISEILTTINFEDVEHALTILNEEINDVNENFVATANKYIASYVKKNLSKSHAMREIMFGITEVLNYKKLSKKNIPELLDSFKTIFEEVKKQGALIHVICDSDDKEKIKKMLPDFALKSKFTKICEPKDYKLQEYLVHTYEPAGFDFNKTTCVQSPAQAGYSCFICKASAELTPEQAAESVLTSYMNGHQLWEKIRMQGGAYGGHCAVDGRSELFTVMSWRDPTPEKSLDAYLEILKEVSEYEFSKADIERCILSEYSDFIVPDSPAGYGSRGFNRYIAGFTDQQFKKEVKLLLSVTPEQVHQAAVRLYENAIKENHRIMFCDNSKKSCGNIIKMHL